MVDDWMRKYQVLAGQAHFKAEEPKHQEPVVAKPAAPAVVVDDTPASAAKEPAKKPARKRTVKKELNDAAEKPKRKPAVKKPAVKRKPASHKPE